MRVRGGRLILLALACALPAAGETPLEKRLAAEAARFHGTLGVAGKNLATGETFAVKGDVRFPTASLIKVAVMVEAYHQIAEGKLEKERRVALAETDKAGDEAVVLNLMRPGIQPTVSDLLALMIAFSDNTATNMLVRLVGTANVDARMESYGLKDTKIFRPTFRDGHADVFPELEKEFGLGMTTPREMARLFELLAEGKVVSAGASREMLSTLEKQFDRQMIPRSLPYTREEISVANKTGWDEEKLKDAEGVKGEIRTDAAYVKGPRARYVLAICTRRGKDKHPGADNEALVLGARLARMVYDAFSR